MLEEREYTYLTSFEEAKKKIRKTVDEQKILKVGNQKSLFIFEITRG